jgi:hypothetical protein
MSKKYAVVQGKKNIQAFWSVFDEYIQFKSRSELVAQTLGAGNANSRNNEGSIVKNLARPSTSDFCADVELAWESYLRPRGLLVPFINEYIKGDMGHMSKGQRVEAERKIGGEFRRRRIYPVNKYFSVPLALPETEEKDWRWHYKNLDDSQ